MTLSPEKSFSACEIESETNSSGNIIDKNGDGKITQYCLLEPLPLGNGEFSGITNETDLGTYLGVIFKVILGIIGVLAVVMIIVGGVQYMTTDAIGGKESGKETIGNAIAGLVLALSSWLILNTINPDLVSFKLNIKEVGVQGVTLGTPEAIYEQTGSEAGGTKLCSSTQTCQQVCNTYCTNSGTSCNYTEQGQPSEKEIQNIPNVSAQGSNVRITSTTETGLKKFKNSVDSLLSSGNLNQGSYTLQVASGYRTISRQLELACPNLDKVPTQVAYPGASPHGTGVAVDVWLYKNGAKMDLCNVENSKTLDKIMTESGFVRYTKEAWHYEYGVATSSLRCTYPNCPIADYCQGL